MYSREIDGEVLTLAASGWTYRNTFVLYDHQTESLWYHIGEEGLTCIAGFYADRQLPEITSQVTRWKRWKAEHEGTGILKYP